MAKVTVYTEGPNSVRTTQVKEEELFEKLEKIHKKKGVLGFTVAKD